MASLFTSQYTKTRKHRLNSRIWQRPHLFGKIVYRNQSNVPLLSFIVFDIRISPLGSAISLVLSTVAVLFTSLSPLQCESQKRATFNMPSPLQWLRRGQEGQRHCLAGRPQKSTLAKTRNELLSWKLNVRSILIFCLSLYTKALVNLASHAYVMRREQQYSLVVQYCSLLALCFNLY